MKKSMGAKTIIYPTPVLIVGSYDERERPNIMSAAWGGICCSKPPCVTVSLREARQSYENIMKTRAYTINIPSASQVKEADYVGIYSGRDEDKFAATNLTPVKSDLVNAPYVEEFPLVLECKVIEILKLGIHTQFVGEILDLKVDESVIDDNGKIDMRKIDPFIFSPSDSGYYRIGDFIAQAFSVGKKG